VDGACASPGGGPPRPPPLRSHTRKRVPVEGRHPPPHDEQRYFFFFLAAFFFFAIRSSPPFLRIDIVGALLPLTLLGGLLPLATLLDGLLALRHVGSHLPPVGDSVTHRFAPQMRGLVPAPALVVVEIGVELRETDDRQAAPRHPRIKPHTVARRAP